jgi:ribonuclease P protein component
VDEKSLHNAARKGAIASRASDRSHGRAKDEIGDGAGLDFPRECRLHHRAEYDAVYREGKRKTGREVTVFLRPNGLHRSRFGWSVKRALGTAVRRNRIRRRLREVVRLHRQEIALGWDLVIHPRSSAATAKFSSLEAELMKLLPQRIAEKTKD